jgi:hypothetical protein
MLNLYLPLFNNTQNQALKLEYLNLINHLLTNAYELELNIMDCYELSILSLMHTSFDETEKLVIKKWKKKFEDDFINRLRFDHQVYSFNLNKKKDLIVNLKKKSKSLIHIE